MVSLNISAFADEYSANFDEQLYALKKFGIDYIELRFINGKNFIDLTDGEILEVKKKLEGEGIKISSIGSPIGKINIEEDVFSHVEKAKRLFDNAEILGAKRVRVFSFYFPEDKSRSEVKGKVFDGLEKIVRASEDFDVTLCHENEAKIYGESPENCLEILNHFGGKLKCVFDMGNFVLDGYKPYPDAYNKLFDYIEYFHIKDALYEGAIVPAGKGEAQIKEILSDYRKNGKKDTIITLEPHLQTFDGLNALVGKKFENPYKYENSKASFEDAVLNLKGTL